MQQFWIAVLKVMVTVRVTILREYVTEPPEMSQWILSAILSIYIIDFLLKLCKTSIKIDPLVLKL